MRLKQVYCSKSIGEFPGFRLAISLFVMVLLFIPFDLKSAIDMGGWKASVLQVAGDPDVRYVEDYATGRYGHAWDFDTDKEYHPDVVHGAISSDISSGYLSFTSSGHSQLVWGDMDGTRPVYGQEQIADRWKMQMLRSSSLIKPSQSLPRSEWHVEAAYL